jgi:hypothetical protein
MSELRLGDVIDDYCIKCRRVTNHSIVSILNGEAAKVRCRTCYHDHDYRHEEIPPSKKELKKAELLAAAIASGAEPPPATVETEPAAITPEAETTPVADITPDAAVAPEAIAEKKKGKKVAKK